MRLITPSILLLVRRISAGKTTIEWQKGKSKKKRLSLLDD